MSEPLHEARPIASRRMPMLCSKRPNGRGCFEQLIGVVMQCLAAAVCIALATLPHEVNASPQTCPFGFFTELGGRCFTGVQPNNPRSWARAQAVELADRGTREALGGVRKAQSDCQKSGNAEQSKQPPRISELWKPPAHPTMTVPQRQEQSVLVAAARRQRRRVPCARHWKAMSLTRTG